MSNKISYNYSPNFYSDKRKPKDIKFIILHYTGMKSDKESIKKLTNIKSSVSCHYYIDRKGKITIMVPDLFIAWHAGKSSWKNIKSLNKNSIGIEISNPGHEHGYKSFTVKQFKSLKKIISFLIKKYQIDYKNILGHSDIAPNRKKDPGEKFPWKALSKNKLCLWHTLKINELKKSRGKKISVTSKNSFFRNLSKLGYDIKNSNKNKKYIIYAFQRRFRPKLINSIVDEESYLISKNLISL